MASLIDIRRRLRSVKNIQQITRAMKMVAAAKLRRSQDRVIAARPYASALRDVLANVSSRVREIKHPLLAERDEKRVLVMVVAGDKGLAGAFNTNVNRAFGALMREKHWEEATLVTVGKKAVDFWKRRSFATRASYPGIFARLELRHAKEIAELLTKLFVEGEIDAAYVVYNEFKSVMLQRVVVERLLPLVPPPAAQAGSIDTTEYLFEPSPERILDLLLQRLVIAQVLRALLESNAAFFAAQMTAMDAATRNSSEMIDSLTLYMNKIRQAAITREIIEVVSGA